MNKIGFLQTTTGEFSHTKLFNTVYGLALIGVWAYVCWEKKEIQPLDPTLIAPIGLGQLWNSVNKRIESIGDPAQRKIIDALLRKARGEK